MEKSTQFDINLGVASVHMGFAALIPAEFMIIRKQQIAQWQEATAKLVSCPLFKMANRQFKPHLDEHSQIGRIIST